MLPTLLLPLVVGEHTSPVTGFFLSPTAPCSERSSRLVSFSKLSMPQRSDTRPSATTRTGPPRRMKTRPLPRHPAPKLATVTLLDADSAPITTVPVAALAYTRALAPESVGADATTAAVQVCAHFERHGACNRGHRCRAAHRPATCGVPDAMPVIRRQCTPIALTLATAAHEPPSPRSMPDHELGARGGSASSASCRSAASDSGGSEASKVHSPRVHSSRVHTSRGWRHSPYSVSHFGSPLP
jgi:hypothetical protein